MNISNRIKDIRSQLGLSQEDFAESIGITRSTLSQIEINKQLPTLKTLQEIAKKYSINYKFLIDGVGYANLSANLNANPKDKKHYKSDYQSMQVNEPHQPYGKGIPLYNVEVSAGAIQMYDDEKEAVIGTITIPGFMDCDLAVINYGHSMYPTYENGCILICKEVKDKSIILYGENYLVRTKEYRMVKRLQMGATTATVLAVSDNTEKREGDKRKYETQPIHLSKIIQLWIIKGVVKKSQI